MTNKSLFIILVIATLALLAMAQSATKEVTTPVGTIRGYLSDKKESYVFRGIPYVNSYKRWEHSTVYSGKFSGVFDARDDAPASPQPCHLPPHTCPRSYDEFSALALNIFAPTNANPNEKIPVMVYLHGGNYFQGSNDTPLYNGTTVAAIGNVIVVTINYRLGILGYYRDEELGIWGNYGSVDQINALKWVQNNIAAFGGDVNNVTLFGQSAGAGSTCVHLISKYSEGLFHKVIIHSNPFAIPFRSIKTKAGLSSAFRKHSKCTTRDCLLALPADAIVDAQVLTATDLDAASGNLLSVFIPFNPYVETPGSEPQDPQYPGLVPYQPHEAFLRGLARNVPMIIGLVTQESDVFIYQAFEESLDDFGYGVFGYLIFGDERNKRIQARYPPTKGIDNRDGLTTVGSEFIFHCSNRNATRGAITTSVKKPVYSYVFDSIYQFNDKMWGPDFSICSDRVCHAAELVSFWNSAQWMFDYDSRDQALANQVGYFWTNFAWTSNPNTGPNASKLQVSWEQYSTGGRTMALTKNGNGSHMVDNYLGEQCDFWDSIGYFL